MVAEIETLVDGDSEFAEDVLCDIRGERDVVDDCELMGLKDVESEFFESTLEVEDNVDETVTLYDLDRKPDPDCTDIVGSPDIVGEIDDEAESDS